MAFRSIMVARRCKNGTPNRYFGFLFWSPVESEKFDSRPKRESIDPWVGVLDPVWGRVYPPPYPAFGRYPPSPRIIYLLLLEWKGEVYKTSCPQNPMFMSTWIQTRVRTWMNTCLHSWIRKVFTYRFINRFMYEFIYLFQYGFRHGIRHDYTHLAF